MLLPNKYDLISSRVNKYRMRCTWGVKNASTILYSEGCLRPTFFRMAIHIIRERATPEQISEMLDALGIYIKLAVDIEQQVIAGGGEMHYDFEQVLLAQGSFQANIWGADWTPIRQRVAYESMINLRPRSNNSMEILEHQVRVQVDRVILSRLGGV
jgi:Protein of unknown function (DUF5674)